MPVYNGELYLREAIDSVLAQTFTDYEFIIINDGSTDNSKQIIESYDDSRILLVNQENMGVAKSLNKGINIAVGEYIWRHDADDICLPDQLEKQLQFLKSNPEFSLVSAQIAFMTDRGKIAWDYRQPKNAFFEDKPFVKVLRNQFNPYSPITHATVLMKREELLELGGYRTEFKTSEDTDLWLRWIEKYDAAVLNYCSYFVRLNATSATQKFKNTTNFYRDTAFNFADERKRVGSDPSQRGESFPLPESNFALNLEDEQIKKKKAGYVFRKDLLSFKYKVMVNAKDYKNIFKIVRFSLKDGWKLSKTWRAILFPLLGNKVVKKGVELKKKLQ